MLPTPAPASPPPAAVSPAATPNQLCSRCNALNAAGAKFCKSCGGRLTSRPGTGNLAPNTMLANRFLSVRKIAQGGMGAVYLVVDTHLKDSALQRDKPWALKEMSQSSVPSEQLASAVKMFQREATMLAHLDHTNLPRVIDCFEHDSKQYLVMDYIEGETLQKLLEKNKAAFRLDEVAPWVRQLIGVLSYLHNQRPPIIYRDLKPANIMRDARGTLKLIDFGIARFKRTTGVFIGFSDELPRVTPGYAPPEQMRQGEVGPAADVYALGVTLHQLLTNFDPTQPMMAFQLPLACDVNPNVPRPVAEMLARAHEPNLQKRIATMREFEREFESALGAARGNRPFAGGGNPGVPPVAPGGAPVSLASAEPYSGKIIYAQARFQANRLEKAAWCKLRLFATQARRLVRGWQNENEISNFWSFAGGREE